MAGALVNVIVAAEKTVAEEGRDIILSMLVVGLVFLGVVALGELIKYVSHRRRAQR